MFQRSDMSEAGGMNRCRRDYEAEIERLKAHRQRAETLRDALRAFFVFNPPDKDGFTFLGELMWIIQKDDQMIDVLIKEQEKGRE